MKRRTIDPSKLRRPLKRSRITESIYGSLFLYVRFFLVWVVVLTADFLLEFRFEYLWPFWLLLRSAYDSFKYQGLAFSLLFLALAFCSDLMCLMFLPVHWLFFAASTYVWVQFVWHTDRGLCLPTVSLWLLFVYVEASVRLRELKNLPFHLDLCRPFAAHCIGYPVVTLGYGVKSYVGYKMKQRKMQQVAKENEFYMQLINLALPSEVANPPDNSERPTRVLCGGRASEGELTAHKGKHLPAMTNGINTKSDVELFLAKEASRRGLRLSDLESTSNTKGNLCAFKDYHTLSSLSKKGSEDHNLNELSKHNLEAEKTTKVCNGRTGFSGMGKSTRRPNGKVSDKVKEYEEEEEDDSDSDSLSASSSSVNGSRKNSRSNSPKGYDKLNSLDVGPGLLAQLKEERALRRRSESNQSMLETDVKRLKAELHASRQCEQDLRCNMHTLMANERQAKSELQQLRAENDLYQQKNVALSAAKQQDRNNILSLERKLKTERDARLLAESQLREERKKQKTEDTASKYREEASLHEACIALKSELEDETRQLRALFVEKEEELKRVEKEAEALRKKSKENENVQFKKETEILMSALATMQGKNTHLENSLSSETRLKLDLFSALGETRRQLEITQNKLASSERELEALKAKIAEAMAVMPSAGYSSEPGVPCFTSNHVTAPHDMNLHTRSLDPSAPCYVPTHKKNGLL